MQTYSHRSGSLFLAGGGVRPSAHTDEPVAGGQPTTHRVLLWSDATFYGLHARGRPRSIASSIAVSPL